MTWHARFIGPNGEKGKYLHVCDTCKHESVCRLPKCADAIQTLLTSQDGFCGGEKWANGSVEMKCEAFELKEEPKPETT
jgi:hypothetical protein